ncbi:hypothetical protein M0812_28939 [Anaeramoeba flamelloides]|uniref:Uncharacterized protein n=1 Tax=Anaeramoeba flamelloides TaxID=1746091 RepID=A0AAV7YG00_9EUKA|nr:hypothetical protein M0812_28939 [Anaeramoeba flamelloides]
MFLLWQIQQTNQIKKIVYLLKKLGDLIEKLQEKIRLIINNLCNINNINCIIDEAQWIQTILDQMIIKDSISNIKKVIKDNVQERWLSQKKIFIDLFVDNFYCFKEIEQQTIFEFKQIDRFNEYLGYLKLSNHDKDYDQKRATIQIEEKIIENILKEFIQEKIKNKEINLNEEIYKKFLQILINYFENQSKKDSQERTFFEDKTKKGKLPDFSPSQQQQNNKKPNSIRYNPLPEWSKNHIILIKKGRNSSSLNCNDDLEFIKKKESGTIIKPNESTRPDFLLFLSPQKIEEEEKEEEELNL